MTKTHLPRPAAVVMDVIPHALPTSSPDLSNCHGPTWTSARTPSSRRHFAGLHATQTLAGDVSSNSGSDTDHDCHTDYTNPTSIDTTADDMQPDGVEDFRDKEYPQLKGKVYLDHGGATLYAKSLIEDFSADLIANLYGNPHSACTPSALAGRRVDEIRERSLRFFNADPQHWDLIFVANATAAVKLVIDCFIDHAAASNTPVWYGYHKDAHTSLVGVRESTRLHRCFTSDDEVDKWIQSGGLGGPRARQLGLFAYPGQSNMTGRRLPLTWPGRIRKSLHKAATYTLLDAAALASTAPLDLSDPATAPDFVALSYYKIFGFPNVGALLVRKDSANVLESRKYFGGGTVEMIIAVHDTWHAKKETSLHDRLEDGTLPFHSIFALDHAMNVHERLYGPNPMKFISHHTSQLGKQLYDGMARLTHPNGLPVCRIYKDESAVYGDPAVQGATVAFNVQRMDGSLVGFDDVEEAADNRNIFVRSGSLCNPGGLATYLNWSPSEMKAAFVAGHRCSNPTQIVFGKLTGVVRASIGAMSTSSDVSALLRFLQEAYMSETPGSLVPATPSQMHPEMLPPVSPVSAFMPLEVPPSHSSASPPHNDVASSAPTPTLISKENMGQWASVPTVTPLTQAPVESKRTKNPPFIPADYINLRKPWEEQLRKQQLANVSVEVKVADVEDASAMSRSATPSVKARRFGRSVVNLLRTKPHQPDNNHVRYDTGQFAAYS